MKATATKMSFKIAGSRFSSICFSVIVLLFRFIQTSLTTQAFQYLE